MKEYIEREAAYEKCGWYNTVNGKSVCAVRKDELAAIPAADVAPVVHGRWERIGVYANCTNCGITFEAKPTHYVFERNNKFCRMCGARMDGE